MSDTEIPITDPKWAKDHELIESVVEAEVRPAGYVVRREVHRNPWHMHPDCVVPISGGEGAEEFAAEAGTFLSQPKTLDIVQAYNLRGEYIGDEKTAIFLCEKKGIAPELRGPDSRTCSIGKSTDGKWYGWSHRALYGFEIGDVAKEGDCVCSSGWTDEYLAEHPEEDLSVPVGFEAKTEDDCKRMAIAFAESVG